MTSTTSTNSPPIEISKKLIYLNNPTDYRQLQIYFKPLSDANVINERIFLAFPINNTNDSDFKLKQSQKLEKLARKQERRNRK